MTPKEVDQKKILTLAYQTYHRGMNSYAFSKLNRIIGQDLVQDTFVKTWAYLVKKGEIHLMKAFLYHILNQLIIDEYRKHKTSSLDTLFEKGFNIGFDDSKRLVNTLDGKMALLLIGQLTPRYEKVMRMKYIQRLSIKEIALITGQSKNTITVQIHWGLIKLRKLYNNKT